MVSGSHSVVSSGRKTPHMGRGQRQSIGSPESLEVLDRAVEGFSGIRAQISKA